jgi:hypothetical protein
VLYHPDEMVSDPDEMAHLEVELLDSSRNEYSQNGEDGIVEAIFARIGETTRWCCEFGAWDGVHFSNTRHLVNNGWSALLIESDPERYDELRSNNSGNDKVISLNRMVDADQCTLDALLAETEVPQLDLLVVDVDGHDYDIFASLQASPRVICIEVNAGHSPTADRRLPPALAARNIGQPLGLFAELAKSRGYQLVAYSGNAFFVRTDAAEGLPSLSPTEAYDSFLEHLGRAGRQWLYHVNRGDVPPYRRFHNERLTREGLTLSRHYLGLRFRAYRLLRTLRRQDEQST